MLDFPNSPTTGATFTSGGITWTWDGTKWTLTASGGGGGGGGGGGLSPGTPPVIVQFKATTADNSQSIVLNSAPINGNTLVAMTSNVSVNNPGAGWTRQFLGGSGTDYTAVFTKLCGAGESTTQTPLSASFTSASSICMWELSGVNAAGNPVFATGNAGGQPSATFAAAPTVPAITNLIHLCACFIMSNSLTILQNYNCDVTDQTINTGNRRVSAGHSVAGRPIFGQMNTFSGSAEYKFGSIGLTS